MRTALSLFVLVLPGLLIACNDTRARSADAGGIVLMVDAGTPRDASRDAGFDSGGVDPCLANEAESELTLACNGGVYGSTQRDNELDGDCVPDGADGPGSCFTPVGPATPICADVGDGPVCVYQCPLPPSYVWTGGCPRGSRCFATMGGGARCFRDCFGNSDCFSNERCDAERSCVPR